MQLKKVALADTKSFSQFFLDYIQQKDALKPFYNRFPTIENFGAQIKEKSGSFPAQHRKILTASLLEQYKNLKTNDLVKNNIQLLQDSKTFTITTGHQLNIFTGPMYFIFKIVTVIKACEVLKSRFPEYNFVPVYWMASEDHDYDEIKYFRLYGKKYTWETNQKGTVGRFSTEGLESLAKQLPGDTQIFQDAYKKHKTLADAVRAYVNALFGDEGLVVIDSDNRALKSLFKNVIKADILNCTTHPVVEQTNKALEKIGYKVQVFCRDINFFYLDNQLRGRIEKQGENYRVIETDLNFKRAEMEELIESEPEKFSPNVILRPLYQEVILPNLAYVGGPAEVVYWLQLKGVFDLHKVPFPMLMPRNFAMIIDHTVQRKIDKLGLTLENLFEDKNYLFNHWTLKHTSHNLTVGAERESFEKIFEELRQRAGAIDKTLEPYLAAEGKRAINSLEKIEWKMLRAEKRIQSEKLRQIEAVKNELFPGGNLQERTDNFLNFYQKDQNFIKELLKHFDPFDFTFNVLQYPT